MYTAVKQVGRTKDNNIIVGGSTVSTYKTTSYNITVIK